MGEGKNRDWSLYPWLWIPEWKEREWFVSIVNTLLEEDFKDLINDNWRACEQKVIKSKNLKVPVQNKFIEIFKNSKFISASKGKTYFFLSRKPKARKEGVLWEEIEEINENSNGEFDGLVRKITEMPAKIDDYQFMEEESKKNKDS